MACIALQGASAYVFAGAKGDLTISQAEEAARACAWHSQALRAATQQDADAARARRTPTAAPQPGRWDAVRAETEAGFEHLQVVERRFAERTWHAETALGALRFPVGLLDQINRVEAALAGVRVDAQPDRPPPESGDLSYGRQR